MYKNINDFWAAAEKAYTKGKPSMGGVLRKFPGKNQFLQSLEEYEGSRQKLEIADAYLPGAAARNVYVRLFFKSDDAPAADKQPAADDKKPSQEKESLLDKGSKALQGFKKLLDEE